MVELVGCKECGSAAELVHFKIANQHNYLIRCSCCDNEGRCYVSKQNAVKMWNKRNRN